MHDMEITPLPRLPLDSSCIREIDSYSVSVGPARPRVGLCLAAGAGTAVPPPTG